MDSNSTTKLLAGPKKTHSYFPSLCECVKRGYTECKKLTFSLLTLNLISLYCLMNLTLLGIER